MSPPSTPATDPIERLVLLLLRADGKSSVPSRLFLQKEVFALCGIMPELSGELGFEAHLLGPYSDVLTNELEQLQLSGLVSHEGGAIRLTQEGAGYAAVLSAEVSKRTLDQIEQTKQLLNDLSSDELLAMVYLGREAGAYRDESEEFARIEKSRLQLALKLFRKGKVSASRAAEIGGISVDDLVERIDKLPA